MPVAQQLGPIAQAQAGGAPGPAAVFYLTLLFIFVTAIVTTVLTKWTRDKCLKFFRGYHVTLERLRGQTIWGRLKVFRPAQICDGAPRRRTRRAPRRPRRNPPRSTAAGA